MIHTEHRRVYWVWADMMSRCRNQNHRAYANYGGRGISVCMRWEEFKNFLADMGSRPAGLLLDRRNNNGNYEPGNCGWVTRTEQNSNRRNCIFVVEAGESVTIKEACRRRGIKYRPVMKRIRNRGWTVERALSTPIRGAR